MEHPDVVNLENVLEKVWEKRDIEAQRDVLKKEYDVDEELPASVFYCKVCKKDYFPKRVVKVEQNDWNTGGTFRFWRSKHCGTWNVRLISQKLKDRFFIKSPSICRDRRVYRLHLLQPQESGYNMMYKKNV